jgi:hypothetical protein
MQGYEALPRASVDSDDVPQLARHENSSWLQRFSSKIPGLGLVLRPSAYVRYVTPRRRKRSVLRLLYWTAFALPYVVLILVLFAGALCPSYTHRPAHYNALRQRSLQSDSPGRANPNNEKIFIAAAIYEEKGELSSGAWGQALLDLVELLGPQNVHLSIYENDADAVTQQSLNNLRRRVTCE